jgi:hypothetical protein
VTGQFLAVDTTTLPWEERYSDAVGKAIYRKEAFSDPDTGMLVRLVRYPAGVINPAHTHPCGQRTIPSVRQPLRRRRFRCPISLVIWGIPAQNCLRVPPGHRPVLRRARAGVGRGSAWAVGRPL